MQHVKIPRLAKRLLALSVLLLPISCAPAVNSAIRPPIERLTPPAVTEIPEGEAICTFDPARRCLSDQQNADLLRRYEAGERARDRQFCWLLAWFGYPACTATE